MFKLKTGALLIAASIGFYMPQSVFALGSAAFSNETGVSAKATAHGFAFAGVADDSSAIFYNPAGLVQVKGEQTMLGGSFVSLDGKHTTPSGTEDTMASHTPFVPYFYTSYSGTGSKWAYGLGVNSPFGLLTDWKNDSFSKYYATETKLLMYMVNPTVAYSVTDSVSVGGGVDYLDFYDTELHAKVSNVLPGSTDGDSKLTGNGHAWGYNLGVHWKATEKHSFGLSYRSQVNVPIKGDIELTGLNPLVYGVSNLKTSVTTEFKIPQSVLFGYGFKPNDSWTLFADYQWADWKVDQNTDFNYDNTSGIPLPTRIPRDWRSTNNIGLGAELKATQNVDVRFGALAYERVVPSGTLESTLPDSSREAAMIGAGFHWGQSSVDLGYQAIFFNSRSVTNAAGNAFASMNGKFETMVNVLTLGFSQKWGGA